MSPMKKLLLGCLGVTLLVLIVGGVLGYVYILQPARDYLAALQEMGTLRDLERQVLNQNPFEPPASGELSQAMVERVAGVHRSVRDALGAEFERLAARYADLEAMTRASGQVGARDVLALYRDLARAVGEAKRAQVAALNEAGISLAEYEWVERQMYEAAGLVVNSLDLDALREAATRGAEAVDLKRSDAPPASERNKALVEPYLDTLKQWLPLAWFGM